MIEKDFLEIKKILSQPKRIVIIPHRNPDGDAMGSSLAMYKFLKNKGHSPLVLAPTVYPSFLQWLPNNETVEVFDHSKINIIESAEIIFFMDFNSLSRIDDMRAYIEKSTAIKIMIDHHQQPDDFADYTYSDADMCATSEMVYHFLEKLDGQKSIDNEIATCIYTGILTDTGSFRFNKTTSTTHRIVADLLDRGAINHKIYSSIYDNNTMARMKLMGIALNNLVVKESCNTAYITLNKKELLENGYEKGDTEGFVNMALSIKGITLAAIFIENEKEIDFVKVSLRSKGNYSVNKMARENFEGGGHDNAAGGKLELPIDEVVKIFEKAVNKDKDKILNSYE